MTVGEPGLEGFDTARPRHRHELLGADLSRARDAVGATVEHALGEEAWREAPAPEIPETELLSSPYTYSKFRGEGVAVQHEESQT
ncbi:hypothetical protein OG963_01135 [Streptomyces sp. NBC_01707]|uniref:hypothetical protein n=1 Tax=unclassified Streptomyces TaxID=2593676 RepID=UPI0029BE0034|nr:MULTISPECIES: hypothetical protein [unclassified Streptomyces]MDX3771799.1 hypothetical protein [Streptomyces sp. AK08-01B]MDX3821351.1 hypothetical protein [Streptomyces sp. AK08-01A]